MRLHNRPHQFRDPATIKADLCRLVRQRGLGRFGIFHASGDGKLLPDGADTASGYVIDDSAASSGSRWNGTSSSKRWR